MIVSINIQISDENIMEIYVDSQEKTAPDRYLTNKGEVKVGSQIKSLTVSLNCLPFPSTFISFCLSFQAAKNLLNNHFHSS